MVGVFRLLVVLLLAVAFDASAQMDVKAMVSQSIRNYQRDWQNSGDWTSFETDVITADGTKEVGVSQVIPLAGTPYDRLIEKNGQPLTPSEQHKEDRKYEHAVRQRHEETAPEREERIHKYKEQRAFVNDIPNAYNFTLLGQEDVDGRAAWIVGMTPRPGFIPSKPHGSMLAHIEGKLWIDQGELRWAKAEAHVIDTIGIGWILARIAPGTRFTLEQTRVEPDLWMPRRITIAGAAHVMIFHSKSLNEELTWSGYKKDGRFPVEKREASKSPGPGVSKSFH
jgi:hypothetical protein